MGRSGTGRCSASASPGRAPENYACRPGARVAYAAGEAAQCWRGRSRLAPVCAACGLFQAGCGLIVDDVELQTARRGNLFCFPDCRFPSLTGRQRRNRLRLSGAAADFLGERRVCDLCPARLRHAHGVPACRLARNYTDADSEFERITIRVLSARRHMFVTPTAACAGGLPGRLAMRWRLGSRGSWLLIGGDACWKWKQNPESVTGFYVVKIMRSANNNLWHFKISPKTHGAVWRKRLPAGEVIMPHLLAAKDSRYIYTAYPFAPRICGILTSSRIQENEYAQYNFGMMLLAAYAGPASGAPQTTFLADFEQGWMPSSASATPLLFSASGAGGYPPG